MLGLFKTKEDYSDKMKKDMERRREKIILRAASLRKLVGEKTSGWDDYVELLQEYVTACKRRKAVTALDTADDKTLLQLKMIDHEVWLIETFILKIPQKMFDLENKMDDTKSDKMGVLDD